jgi:hypothetical protein
MCCFVSVNADDNFTFMIHEALIANEYPGTDPRGQDCDEASPSGSYEVTSRQLPGQLDGQPINKMTRSQS